MADGGNSKNGGGFKRNTNGKFLKARSTPRISNLHLITSAESENDAAQEVFSGNRICNLDFMINQLRAGCFKCGEILNLTDVTAEKREGLASIITLCCSSCRYLNDVHTSKKHASASAEKGGRHVYDVNTKAATGMIHAGIGATHVNAFLTSINVPAIDAKTLKRKEREIGPAIESLAKKSCTEALWEERELSNDEIKLSYDMGWQKRGRGYNSQTGVGHMIGNKGGKVVGYNTRNKRCATCHKAFRNGKRAKKHDCRRNWFKSSKAMEPDVAKEIALEIMTELDTGIHSIIGDEDSTTTRILREEVDRNIVKESDIIHVKKTLNNHLHEIKSNHKELTETVISHICKCFTYAVSQNKGNTEGLKKALACIIPHCFGCHASCGDWCGYWKNPRTYTHRGIKGDLKDSTLRKKLDAVMLKFITNANKFSSGYNSQANESLNNIIGSKTPKTRHYGGSESNDFRVAAAVCQKNYGREYVSKVHETMRLSPGKYTKMHNIAADKQRASHVNRQQRKDRKLRRLQLKKEKSMKATVEQVREGTSYQSNVGYEDHVDTENIPPPTVKPSLTPVSFSGDDNSEMLVIFDLETTCLGYEAEITQLAAVTWDGQHSFNQYVLPKGQVSARATQITGISVTAVGGQRALIHHGKIVASCGINEALGGFCQWMDNLHGKDSKPKVVLCGHNARVFDTRVLLAEVIRCDFNEAMEQRIVGFMDTLPVFKSQFPGLASYSQPHLYNVFTGNQYVAHDALEDVNALRKLLHKALIPFTTLYNYTATYKSAFEDLTFQMLKKQRMQTFTPMSSSLTSTMIDKMASSGLCYQHVRLAYNRGGEEGVRQLLGEPVDGTRRARVTKCRRVLGKVFEHLVKDV